jgi:hypothetical protein
MKVLKRSLIGWPLLVIALGAGAPMYAGTAVSVATVEGHLGQNLDVTSQAGTTLFDTGAQTGSPVSTTLPTWSFTCTTCSGYGITGSGAAKVINGSLGANSTVTVTGSPGPNFLSAADNDADYIDTLTITGGTGNGVLALQYELDGSLSHTGTGPSVTSFLALADPFATNYQLGSGAVNGGSEADFFGDVATSGTVTFYVPFTYGTAFTNELNLDAFAAFASGDSTPFTATVDFYNTAALHSALVFAGTPLSLGAENTAADIGSTSGISYGPNGSSATPEPGTLFLLASAMGVLGWVKRGRVFRAR